MNNRFKSLLLMLSLTLSHSLSAELPIKNDSKESDDDNSNYFSEPLVISELSSYARVYADGGGLVSGRERPHTLEQEKPKPFPFSNRENRCSAFQRQQHLTKEYFVKRFGPSLATKLITETSSRSFTVIASGAMATVWKNKDGVPQHRLFHLGNHTKKITFMTFGQNDTVIATCSRDKTVEIWSLVTGKHLYTLPNHYQAVTFASFNAAGDELAVTTQDGSVRIWYLPPVSHEF